jgi:hypothetical protein
VSKNNFYINALVTSHATEAILPASQLNIASSRIACVITTAIHMPHDLIFNNQSVMRYQRFK